MVVCTCNRPWYGVTPPPPCPFHTPDGYCRDCGTFGLHQCSRPRQEQVAWPAELATKLTVYAPQRKPPCIRVDLHCYCEDSKATHAGRKPHVVCCHCGHEKAK